MKRRINFAYPAPREQCVEWMLWAKRQALAYAAVGYGDRAMQHAKLLIGYAGQMYPGGWGQNVPQALVDDCFAFEDRIRDILAKRPEPPDVCDLPINEDFWPDAVD